MYLSNRPHFYGFTGVITHGDFGRSQEKLVNHEPFWKLVLDTLLLKFIPILFTYVEGYEVRGSPYFAE